MFAKTKDEKLLMYYLQKVAAIATTTAYDEKLSLDERMLNLQVIYKKIPDINRTLIRVKTAITNPPPNLPENPGAA